MTSVEDGFFHALQQSPDDDALRLVYADFLEESGGAAATARAELIRVQVELSALKPSTRRAAERAGELAVRQNELLAEWERVWLGGWAEVLGGWAFRRGLVEGVVADASAFLEHAPYWFAQWPTLTVAKLTRAGGHLRELAASPWLAHLRGLDLSQNGIDAGSLAQLTASRFICLLRGLDLSDNPIGPRGGGLLATAPMAGELSELHLARCELGPKGVEGLCEGRARQWRRLDLSGNWLSRRDVVLMADSPAMPGLAALDLASNRLGDNGASALTDSPRVTGLVDLGLCDTGLGEGGLAALAGSRNLTNLRSLDLRGNHCWACLDPDDVSRCGTCAFSRSPLLGRLRRLLLASRGPGNGWVAEVLAPLRPARRQTVEPGGILATRLRESRYLMPSQLVECDLEELWWLGDTRNRERLPSAWADGDWPD